jgi:hypothetical protein
MRGAPIRPLHCPNDDARQHHHRVDEPPTQQQRTESDEQVHAERSEDVLPDHVPAMNTARPHIGYNRSCST